MPDLTPQHADGRYYDPEDEDDHPTRLEPTWGPSPARHAEQCAALLADIRAAALPTGTQLAACTRDEIALAAVEVTLPDRRRLLVLRDQIARPYRFHGNAGDGVNADATLADVPGTTSTAVLYPAFGRTLPGEGGRFSTSVQVVTREGMNTTWVAPQSLALSMLRDWAFTAAQRGS